MASAPITINLDSSSDPARFGPGIWFVTHVGAIEATDDDKIIHFINLTRVMFSRIPCSTCRQHAMDYLTLYPPEDHIKTVDDFGDRIGMFTWSWVFHNSVNCRLGKPTINYHTAYNLYKDGLGYSCQFSQASPKSARAILCRPFSQRPTIDGLYQSNCRLKD